MLVFRAKMRMNTLIKIGDQIVGAPHPVFVIAEAGVNHNGDLEMGKRLIEVAKDAGADAVKFQTFITEELNTKTAPKSTYHIKTTGAQQGWFDLLKTQELNQKAHEVLIEHCNRVGIMFLSTPYDEQSADLLERFDVPAFKIASTDSNNLPFLRYIAKKGRPMILSTGMCNQEEVGQAVETISSQGLRDLIVLHCTANYPAPLEDTNLLAMETLRKAFGVLVGYSDHTQGNINAIASTILGSCVYERHFTLDRTLPGPDHPASLEPHELKETIELIRKAQIVLGSTEKKVTPSEIENRQKLRKSVVSRVSIPSGTVLTREMLTTKRPGTGLAPSILDSLIGLKAKVGIEADSLIRKEFFE